MLVCCHSFPSGGKKALSGGWNQGKKVKKKDKEKTCVPKKSCKRKKNPEASGHASRERDINKTKLHTLRRNAWSCSLGCLSFQTNRRTEKGGGGFSLPGRSSGSLHPSALWKWRRWSRWCSGRIRSRCFLRTEPAPSICRQARSAVRRLDKPGHKHPYMFPNCTHSSGARGAVNTTTKDTN